MRIFIFVICFSILAVLIPDKGFSSQYLRQSNSSGWPELNKVLKNIKAPVFPNKNYLITNYGAIAGGKINCSKAIARAINACNKAGGGIVIIPAGNFFTGPIYIKSNVNLHLEKGSRLSFSTNPSDYLPLVYTRWEGVELMNYSPLIYAYKESNIAITGQGVIDGQAGNANWWPWKGRKDYGWKEGTPSQNNIKSRPALFAMSEKDVPVAKRTFGNGFFLRPQFIEPYACKNILIEGVTVMNSPMWILHPVLCSNITINNVTVESDGPNTDGCDPESCKDVLIKQCHFNTGDDCIAIKSGRNRDGRRINIPCENIVIQNCTMANGHGGIVIGSEISGGVRNVYAENCIMNSPLLDRALRIKTSSARGGTIENVYLRHIEVTSVREEAVIATMFYEDSGDHLPTIRNINISDMNVVKGGKAGVVMEGYKFATIHGLHIDNLNINNTKIPYQFSNVDGITLNNVIINDTFIQQDKVKVDTTEKKIHW
jgi:polygalacturonase